MNLQQFLTLLLMARQGQQQPSFGRAGGVAPGMPLKPVQGIGTGMGGPLMQQNFGPQQPPAPVVNRDVGTQPGPSQPGGVLYEAGALAARQAAQNAPPSSVPGVADAMLGGGSPQIQPFSPPPLDPGTPLPPEGMGGMGGAPANPLGMGNFMSQGLMSMAHATPIGEGGQGALMEPMGSIPTQAESSIGVGPPESWEMTGGPQSEPITDTYSQGTQSVGGDPLWNSDLESQLMQQSRGAHEKLFLELLRQRGLLR